MLRNINPTNNKKMEDNYFIIEKRKEIDAIDDNIIELLKKRFDIGKQLAIFKKQRGMKLRDIKREREIIQTKVERYPIDPAFTQTMFKNIIKHTRKIQNSEENDISKAKTD